jgi:hypothetical protein
MKPSNKISLAYVLQIFAVVLIFGFAGSSDENNANSSLTDAVLPLNNNKTNSDTLTEDSLLIKKRNTVLPSRIVKNP